LAAIAENVTELTLEKAQAAEKYAVSKLPLSPPLSPSLSLTSPLLNPLEGRRKRKREEHPE
jgi:hypothetical protein